MSFFKQVFGESDSKDKAENGLHWSPLTELKQLDAIAEESKIKPVILFKHSTRCSISRMALKTFEREYAIPEERASLYFLDLLEHRDISNEIARRFGVFHQSPQLVLIRGGQSVYDSSHSDIDAAAVERKINT